MTKHLILMMEVNGSLIINCEGRFISPQQKVIYHYFCHHFTRNDFDIYESYAKKTLSYEGCSWKKRGKNFVQKQTFPMVAPKKTVRQMYVVKMWVKCSSQGLQKEETKVNPPVTRGSNRTELPP